MTNAPKIKALLVRAMQAHQAGRLGEAAQGYRTVLAAEPHNIDALHLLGVVARMGGQPAQGAQMIGLALARDPDFPEAHSNLGNCLRDMGRLDDALAACDRALALKPDYADGLSNKANCLRDLGCWDEAEACYRQALALAPDHAQAWANLGVALREMGRLDEALAAYDKALALAPDHAEARANRAVILLLQGRLAEGFEAYEARLHSPEFAAIGRDWTGPLWDGSPLAGRTLAIHAEQGFGDTLQFCRYLPLVKQLGGRIIFMVPVELKTLLASLSGVDILLAKGEAVPPYDVHVPLLSLPHLLGTTLDTIPADTPYLAAEPGKVAQWGARLGASDGRRVGLVWAGSPRHRHAAARLVDRRRSLPLGQFAGLGQVAGCAFVSLQKGEAAGQAASAPFALADHSAELHDFSDTAALVASLDLVITVDTAMAHLAGALGVPVWVLSRFDGCWRWLAGRDDSPWYPTLRLFRQERAGDWDGVLGRVAASLAQWAPKG